MLLDMCRFPGDFWEVHCPFALQTEVKNSVAMLCTIIFYLSYAFSQISFLKVLTHIVIQTRKNYYSVALNCDTLKYISGNVCSVSLLWGLTFLLPSVIY